MSPGNPVKLTVILDTSMAGAREIARSGPNNYHSLEWGESISLQCLEHRNKAALL
ncbi:hypothetical protein GLOTRDRAFT_116955 [Gloeophyllum trabeum ATCC 11539]|uniref:Uncharacterized protein n=1 Tax=Gloeophyllum trabeum (strain ATCC 11539 / FP-39264 / Madison 617) TaxID=670483 RepID=S7Q1Y2_GLOTA|nr:uncharacterized protein GLOTRDRAFT_116955 [Gloeophyllum trabeum ATCC 11539]EPQ53543.1 hypothetical protein GLOTRDRAFT_116955 [Gloeophyllum trabeum ATCC 11539]